MPKGTPGRPACSIEGCERPNNARGLCKMHYRRFRTRGSVGGLAPERLKGSAEERFWFYVDKTDGCWIWTGGRNPFGYGHFPHTSLVKRSTLAHRFAYELLVGPIPDGLELDHVKARGCTSRACVNPDHLEPVTHAENMRRGTSYWRDRTECIHGHPWDVDNTYFRGGQRRCRACRANQYQARKKSARSDSGTRGFRCSV